MGFFSLPMKRQSMLKRRKRSGPGDLRILKKISLDEPTLLGNVEDDAVGVLELALEVDVVLRLTQIEEERAACCFDFLLHAGQILNDEPEVMGTHESRRVL